MKLHRDGHLLIYRTPGDFGLASLALLGLPLCLGLLGVWGVWKSNSTWDDVLFIPLGICGALILFSVVGAIRIGRRRRGPKPTRALIFDNQASRLFLSSLPWTAGSSADLGNLPGYGYEQFTGWTLRSWTVSGPGNDRMNRSTYYAVSLSKTDGGYFDVFETGWEPLAEKVLEEFRSLIPLEGRSTFRAPDLPLPPSIHRESSMPSTRYWWNTPWSWSGTLRALLYLGLVAGGFFLVMAEAPGEEGDAFRLGLIAVTAALVLVFVAVALVRWRSAQRTVQCLVVRPGVLEYGTALRNDPGQESLRVTQRLDLQGALQVRYDRTANTRSVPGLFLWHEDGSSVWLELEGISEGELVVLEQSLEADIRRHGGTSE